MCVRFGGILGNVKDTAEAFGACVLMDIGKKGKIACSKAKARHQSISLL